MIAPVLNAPQFSAETISGITGSISIASWLVVFSPQIIENFRRQSGEGLSLSFLVIWLAGDVFNVLGAILQHVLPTMIILALYCNSRNRRGPLADVEDTLADIILIAQVLYYRKYPYRTRHHVHPATRRPSHLSPATPLLNFDRPPKKPPPISTIRACINHFIILRH
jgi:solute carrier family 66 (lysosomal lysine-arginine transporter), member 1